MQILAEEFIQTSINTFCWKKDLVHFLHMKGPWSLAHLHSGQQVEQLSEGASIHLFLWQNLFLLLPSLILFSYSVSFLSFSSSAKIFEKVVGRETCSETLESRSSLEKAKFPKDYYPQVGSTDKHLHFFVLALVSLSPRHKLWRPIRPDMLVLAVTLSVSGEERHYWEGPYCRQDGTWHHWPEAEIILITLTLT